jgi:hypothetical protein
MDGLYFVLGNFAVCFIIAWAMANDHAQPAGRTTGLLAMRDDAAAEVRSPSRPGPVPAPWS